MREQDRVSFRDTLLPQEQKTLDSLRTQLTPVLQTPEGQALATSFWRMRRNVLADPSLLLKKREPNPTIPVETELIARFDRSVQVYGNLIVDEPTAEANQTLHTAFDTTFRQLAVTQDNPAPDAKIIDAETCPRAYTLAVNMFQDIVKR